MDARADAGAALDDDGSDGGSSDSAESDGIGEVDGSADVPWCDGPTAHRYDPLVSLELELFPDDLLTRDDPDSPTGLHLDVTVESAPWLEETPDLLRPAFGDLNVLSGFGRNAGVVMRFDAPLGALPASADESLTTDTILFVDLGDSPPTRIPFEVTTLGEGEGIVVWPLRTLRRGTPHAVVVTTAQLDLDGNCIAPAPTLRRLLTGDVDHPRLARMVPRYANLLEALDLRPGDVSAGTVFTTHDDIGAVVEAAALASSGDRNWSAPATCAPDGPLVRCDLSLMADDYRDEGEFVSDADIDGSWELEATAWLPAEGTRPHPVVIYGHGINGSRQSGRGVATRVASLGFAVVAVDAMRHGEHPTADANTDLQSLDFLGIDLEALAIDGLALRGNFDQTTLDQMQLAETIRDAPDIDGDGEADLDGDRMAYWGISLGGMFGSSLLALDDRIGAGVLSVAGGRLITFVTDTSRVVALRPIIVQLVGSEEAFDRLVPVAQALVDPSDPATWGAHVLHDRVVGEEIPDVLFPVVMEDDTVPPATGRALARALRIPHLPPVIAPVATLPIAGTLPLSANVADGTATAGYFQYDRISGGGGAEAATHDNTPLSAEGRLQALHFLETWLETDLAEIIDPYTVLETPPLP